jgi:hypothetical protein
VDIEPKFPHHVLMSLICLNHICIAVAVSEELLNDKLVKRQGLGVFAEC